MSRGHAMSALDQLNYAERTFSLLPTKTVRCQEQSICRCRQKVCSSRQQPTRFLCEISAVLRLISIIPKRRFRGGDGIQVFAVGQNRAVTD